MISKRGYAGSIRIEFATFRELEERTAFVVRRFSRYLQESVLDVGCYEAPMRRMLNGVRYYGIDITGAPDVQFDLDSGQPLPVADRSYRCVVCVEVLEHLDHLHTMFGELVRASSEYLIVSLPNPWRDARRMIERGKGQPALYGLPLERPIDRHKWFFNFTEAHDYLIHAAKTHGVEILEMFATEQHRPAIVRAVRRLRYPGERYFNRYVQTVWTVMRRR